MPDVFAYDDYRTFLRDWFARKKERNPRFSYRVLGEKAGFRSPGFFSQVLQGKSNVSLEMAHRLATVAELDRRETEFFETLVQYNQARSLVEEKRHLDRLLELRPESLRKLARDRAEFLESRHHIVVWQLLEILEVRDDHTAVAAAIEPSVTESDVASSLALLERLSMARRDADRRWRQIDPVLSVDVEIPRAVTRRFYLGLNKLAGEAHDRFHREERHLSWVTLAISDSKRDEIVAEIRAFRRHLVELARRDDTPHDVHQLLIQLFPLTDTRSRRKAST